MIKDIERLYRISQQPSRVILGLMSGTSLDGLDLALCRITGHGAATKLSLQKFQTLPYDAAFKADIQAVFAKKMVPLEKLCLVNEWIGITHAAMINQCLQEWNVSNKEIDCIASHGQTVFHAPESAHQLEPYGNGTLQIGDGDHIAVHTGITTISDFRQKHIAAGGEGAPLAAYGDYILFAEKENNVLLLNIGGIANFSFIPAGGAFSSIICTDTGPGNTLMDNRIREEFPGKYFDLDAGIAKQGSVNEDLLLALKENDFFNLDFPKTTGPELFNALYTEQAQQKSKTTNIPFNDLMATLNRFTAITICEAIEKVISGLPGCKILISGGGVHNPLLIAAIQDYFPGREVSTRLPGDIDPGAKEAVLFALLANEMIAGDGKVFGDGSPGFPAVSMGKISFPH